MSGLFPPRRSPWLVGAAMVGAVFAGAGAAALLHGIARAATGPDAIGIENFSFGPSSLTVAAGTKVVWTNRDDDPHTVTSAADPKLFKSAPLDTDETFAFTFDKPGTYKYFCTIHPKMQGTITVQ